MASRGLKARRRDRGGWWSMGALWLTEACFADDFVFSSDSKQGLGEMLRDPAEAFRVVGLDHG
eukprot:15459396-Alexandrium_andersonii.AAC.1